MKVRINPRAKSDLKSICRQLLVGIDNFQEVTQIYTFSYGEKGVHAHGIQVDSGFVVLRGSLAATYENHKLTARHKKIRSTLVASGVLAQKEDVLEFTRPFLFENEYDATSVISGNNKCRIQTGVWTDTHGKTLLENQLIGISELEIKDI
jgi:hypothetical protein